MLYHLRFGFICRDLFTDFERQNSTTQKLNRWRPGNAIFKAFVQEGIWDRNF